MSILNKLKDKNEKRGISISDPNVGASIFGISSTGTTVNAQTAMMHTTVYACVNVKAQGLSSVPFTLYEETANGREKAKKHPLFNILGKQVNPLMTSVTWRKMITQDIELRGTHFSQIVRDRGGRIVALYPLCYDNMDVSLTVNEQNIPTLQYMYTQTEGGQKTFRQDQILRIIGLPSSNGILGVTPIGQNASSIGLGMSAEEFGNKFYTHGANGSGILSTEQTFKTPEAQERLAKQFGDKYTGMDNSKKPIVLENGMKWQPITISNNDSQFLETRQYQKSDIASIFRVSPHLINDLTNATFSNITELSIEHVKYCLMPVGIEIESAVYYQLLTPKEQESMFVEFNFNGLMRGDFKTRTDAYKNAINGGWMKPNEARRLENMDTDDEVGNKLLIQNSYASLKEVENKSLDTNTPDEGDNNATED
jgi:HK97 family phage portal protein